MIGSVIASHTIATEIIVPATAGLTPATVVIKNEKNDSTKLYDAQSPIDPIVYPKISFVFNFFPISLLLNFCNAPSSIFLESQLFKNGILLFFW